MKTSLRTFAAALAAASLLGAAGCAGSYEEPASVGTSAAEVIGGFPANSPKLNAIGALAFDYGDGYYYPFCSGTLVSEDEVLTAEHCSYYVDPYYTKFVIGPNALAPTRVVPVINAVAETTVQGGIIGLGSDVAIVHLAEAVTDVPILPYAQFEPDRVGERFVVVGYGVTDNNWSSGTRNAGALTLQGSSGRIFDLLFGSFEGFLADGAPVLFPYLNPNNPTDLSELQWLYEFYTVLDGYEAVLGAGLGDANDCYGDSGGPLIQKKDGKSTVFGVVSWGFGSTRQVCDFGGIFAVLGSASVDFINAETAPAPAP